jgi:hypothetical protein
MSKIFITKTSNGLLPADEVSEKVYLKWKNGASYSLEYNKARNPKFHRMVFAVAQKVCDNAPEDSYWNGKDAYHLIKAVELKIGFVDELVDFDGEVHMIPKSIAFENMEEADFKKLFDALLEEGARILGCTIRELLDNVEAA